MSGILSSLSAISASVSLIFTSNAFRSLTLKSPFVSASCCFNCGRTLSCWRLKKKTAPIMRFTVCRGRRRSQRGTRNYPLSALDLTGHLKHRVRWELCAGQQEKRWRDWRISTSICSDTLIQAICFQMELPRKMYRNFSDTLMSVPQ